MDHGAGRFSSSEKMGLWRCIRETQVNLDTAPPRKYKRYVYSTPLMVGGSIEYFV